MGIEFTAREIAVLNGMLAEGTQDLIVRTDRDGFIRKSTPSLDRMGFAGPNGLIEPHLLDLVHPAHLELVRTAFRSALAGRIAANWIEVQLLREDGTPRWFTLQIRPLEARGGDVSGAIAVLRCIEERRVLEEQAFIAQVTDNLTGLANRCAFNQMLGYLVEAPVTGSLAVVDIERFRSINLEHGQDIGDQVLRLTAEVLRSATRGTDILARIGSEKFAIVMPETNLNEAQALAGDLVETLRGVGALVPGGPYTIAYKAGVAAIAASVDDTMRDVELALFLSRANACKPVTTAGQRRLRFFSGA